MSLYYFRSGKNIVMINIIQRIYLSSTIWCKIKHRIILFTFLSFILLNLKQYSNKSYHLFFKAYFRRNKASLHFALRQSTIIIITNCPRFCPTTNYKYHEVRLKRNMASSSVQLKQSPNFF